MSPDVTRDIALYFHWPYCRRICPYCDFNVTRDRGQMTLQTALFEAMRADIQAQSAWVAPRRMVSLYFGGGTPSLMKPEWVAALIDDAKALFTHDQVEITVEANPTDAEISKYRDFAAAGVNRLSLGVQSLEDAALAFLGRDHSARDAIIGIETALKVFDRVSLDLIYALPEQSLTSWEAELRRAAALGIEHISPYHLSIEPDTAFGRAVRRQKWQPKPQDISERFYFKTLEVLDDLGFEAYEVSNHAKTASAQAVHNVAIWRGVDYLGVGPGAHGRFTDLNARPTKEPHGRFTDLNARPTKEPHGRFTDLNARHATVGTYDLKSYISDVATRGFGCDITPMSAIERDEEALMLGLRMLEGMNLNRLKTLDISKKAAPLVTEGFLEMSPTHLKATAKGRLVLDRLLYELL